MDDKLVSLYEEVASSGIGSVQSTRAFLLLESLYNTLKTQKLTSHEDSFWDNVTKNIEECIRKNGDLINAESGFRVQKDEVDKYIETGRP